MSAPINENGLTAFSFWHQSIYAPTTDASLSIHRAHHLETAWSRPRRIVRSVLHGPVPCWGNRHRGCSDHYSRGHERLVQSSRPEVTAGKERPHPVGAGQAKVGFAHAPVQEQGDVKHIARRKSRDQLIRCDRKPRRRQRDSLRNLRKLRCGIAIASFVIFRRGRRQAG